MTTKMKLNMKIKLWFIDFISNLSNGYFFTKIHKESISDIKHEISTIRTRLETAIVINNNEINTSNLSMAMAEEDKNDEIRRINEKYHRTIEIEEKTIDKCNDEIGQAEELLFAIPEEKTVDE